MASECFNITKGSIAEMGLNDATKFGVLLLKTAEADATLRDYDTVADILAGSNVEADFTNYARKTGLTAVVTTDDTNDRKDVDLPDQTWTAAGGASNNTLAKAIVYYEDAAADSTRRPCTHHDFVVTTDGSNLVLQFNAAGFYRDS